MESLRPVYDGYFADPFVWKHGADYYAIGTGGAEAQGDPGQRIFPLLHSKDLSAWTPAGRALLRPNSALGDTFWAPEVAFADGLFYLYYSVGFADTKHHLRVAIGDSPLGPYRDCGAPLVNLQSSPFSIDASPFRDIDSRWYVFFARDYLDTTHGRAGTALAVALLKTMTELEGEPKTVLRARHDWQRFQAERSMYRGIYDWHTLEGPAVIRRGNRYYCFYSAGRWENETYGVDFAVADSVMGPYHDDGNDSGPRVLRTIPGKLIGPGHNSIVTDQHGQDWIVYHAWDPGMTARRMFLSPLLWTAAGPRIAS